MQFISELLFFFLFSVSLNKVIAYFEFDHQFQSPRSELL